MSKPQAVSPLKLNELVLQHLILSELMKISDILAKKEPSESYDAEIQKRVRDAMGKFVKVKPANTDAVAQKKRVNETATN